MFRTFVLPLLLMIPAVLLDAGRLHADEKQAEASIRKLGGEAIHVGFDDKNPIFKVEFTTNQRFSDADLKKAVPVLKQFPDLRVLHIGSPKITNKGLASLADLENLEDLSLVGTSITDAGLPQLAKLPKLKTVNLMLTKVTDKGVADLKKKLPDAEIVHKLPTQK